MASPRDITSLLHEWRQGEKEALERLLPLVYDELRRVAARAMASEPVGHTLQPTALVHEAYIRLVDAEIEWQDRAHFFALAARAMRRILVDHSRARRREKRGGGAQQVPLTTIAAGDAPDADLLDLDEALERLARQDERKASIIELHFFGGLTYDETAEVLGISPATVHRDLRMAKAWLYTELAPPSPPRS